MYFVDGLVYLLATSNERVKPFSVSLVRRLGQGEHVGLNISEMLNRLH